MVGSSICSTSIEGKGSAACPCWPRHLQSVGSELSDEEPALGRVWEKRGAGAQGGRWGVGGCDAGCSAGRRAGPCRLPGGWGPEGDRLILTIQRGRKRTGGPALMPSGSGALARVLLPGKSAPPLRPSLGLLRLRVQRHWSRPFSPPGQVTQARSCLLPLFLGPASRLKYCRASEGFALDASLTA